MRSFLGLQYTISKMPVKIASRPQEIPDKSLFYE